MECSITRILFFNHHRYSNSLTYYRTSTSTAYYELQAIVTNGPFLFLAPESFPFRSQSIMFQKGPQHTSRRLLLSPRELKVKTPDGHILSSGPITKPIHYQRAVIAALFLPPRENNPCYLIDAFPTPGSLEQNRTGYSF